MLASDPEEVASTLERVGREHPEISHMGLVAARFLIAEYADDTSGLVRDSLVSRTEELVGAGATARLDAWLRGFDDATRSWRGA